MSEFAGLIKTADWKSEKHVPVIEAPEKAVQGEMFQVKVSLGKEIAHPNKTEHHIRWIQLYFQPEGSPLPVQVGNAEFTAHGASAEGANEGDVYTNHEVVMSMRTDRPGTLYALSYCNIHGVWQGSKAVSL